eukprot:654023-Hanusia_phi.AAC.1
MAKTESFSFEPLCLRASAIVTRSSLLDLSLVKLSNSSILQKLLLPPGAMFPALRFALRLLLYRSPCIFLHGHRSLVLFLPCPLVINTVSARYHHQL